jgi:hypothetical protein
VKSLEVTQRKQWPLNGLNYAESFLRGLHFKRSSADNSNEKFSSFQAILSQQRSLPSSSLSRLVSLVDSLKILKQLYEEHRIRIRLEKFLDEDKFNVAFTLLNWCTEEEDVFNLINTLLKGLISQWGMNLGVTLKQYFIKITQSSGNLYNPFDSRMCRRQLFFRIQLVLAHWQGSMGG